MQKSELYRRGVVVPLTEKAKQELIDNNVNNETEVDFYEFTDEEIFISLWEKGFIERINSKLGTMLDDYEEDIIEASKVALLPGIFKEFESDNKLDGDEKEVISALKKLCDSALQKNMSLFFVL